MFRQNKEIRNLRKAIKRVVEFGIITNTSTTELMTINLNYLMRYSRDVKINKSKLFIPIKKTFKNPVSELERLEKRFSSKKDGENLAYNVYRLLNTTMCDKNSTNLSSKTAMCDHIDRIMQVTTIKALRTSIIDIRKALILHVNDKVEYNHIITDVYDTMPSRGNHDAIMQNLGVMRNLIKGSFESGNYGETFKLMNQILNKTSCIPK